MLSETISNQCNVEKCGEGRRTFFIKATWRLFRYEVNACLLKVLQRLVPDTVIYFGGKTKSKKVLLFA